MGIAHALRSRTLVLLQATIIDHVIKYGREETAGQVAVQTASITIQLIVQTATPQRCVGRSTIRTFSLHPTWRRAPGASCVVIVARFVAVAPGAERVAGAACVLMVKLGLPVGI
jgi:hypothetical protein